MRGRGVAKLFINSTGVDFLQKRIIKPTTSFVVDFKPLKNNLQIPPLCAHTYIHNVRNSWLLKMQFYVIIITEPSKFIYAHINILGRRGPVTPPPAVVLTEGLITDEGVQYTLCTLHSSWKKDNSYCPSPHRSSRCTLCTIHCTVHCVYKVQSSLPEDQSYCSAVILTVGLATCSCIVYSSVVIPRGPFQIAHQAFYLKIQCYSTANLDVIVTLCVKRVTST